MAAGNAKAEQKSSTESNTDSSASNSDFSSENGSSDVSDLNKFEKAFDEFGRLIEGFFFAPSRTSGEALSVI